MSISEKKNTILIVDDEPDIVNLTDKFLKLGEFDTLTATNGKEALEILEEKHQEINLVLLDIMMPGKSGYTVLEEIKSDDRFKNIIVILFTVKSFNEDLQKGKSLGADGYITKPFSGQQLVQFITNKLNEKN